MNLSFNTENLEKIVHSYLVPFGLKVLGAIAAWIIANIAIKALQKVLSKAMRDRRVDPTLVTYANHTLVVILKGLAVLAILDLFGVQTTSFSALLAAAGVAIGVAWSGLLSNFAAGVFLVILRPFRIGDTITAAGVTGTVKEMGLFSTTIDNGENLRVFVGNNKLFSDNILNYSVNPYRIAQFRIQLAPSVNPEYAIQKLCSGLKSLPLFLPHPEVSGEISEFNYAGTLVTIKAAATPKNHGEAMKQGNQIIYQVIEAEKFPTPISVFKPN